MSDITLDGDTRDAIARLAELQHTIRLLTEEADVCKQIIRKHLAAGDRGTADDGTVLVTVSPNRRFDATQAQRVLPTELLTAIQTVTVDAKKAKAVLPPALYEACMAQVGEPRVVLP